MIRNTKLSPVVRENVQKPVLFILKLLTAYSMIKKGTGHSFFTPITWTYRQNISILKEKILSWISKVSAAVAARGQYDNIPAIMECAKNMF